MKNNMIVTEDDRSMLILANMKKTKMNNDTCFYAFCIIALIGLLGMLVFGTIQSIRIERIKDLSSQITTALLAGDVKNAEELMAERDSLEVKFKNK